jgi:predicted acylesterase/phospholipase RssA
MIQILSTISYIWSILTGWLWSRGGAKDEKLTKRTRLEELEKAIALAPSFAEYERLALEIDSLTGMEEWKRQDESPIYDWAGIKDRMAYLQSLLKLGQVHELKRQLRAGLMRNSGGISDPRLHNACRIGTKHLIEQYVKFMCEALEGLANVDCVEGDFSLEEKFAFFYETRQAFGRSALCLSGGATLGLYHLGVIKVLHENNLLPRVISGSSVGSIIASFVATRRDEELEDLFELKGINFNAFDSKGSGKRKFWRLIREGVIMDIDKLEKMIRENVGDYTFKEAYDRTKRILNITVASTTPHETPCLLNYLTAPNVLIWSAAAASCALTLLYKPVELMAKDQDGNIVPYMCSGLLWADGSMATDLPMMRLAELFNVNHFIVSQVNPHVVPFMWLTQNWGTFGNLLKEEIQVRMTQLCATWEHSSYITLRQIASIISQKYTGDITIVPDIQLDDYKRLISNPQKDWMLEARKRSERKTWAQLSHIKHRCAIELTLDRSLRKLAKELHRSDPRSRLATLYKRYK